MVASVTEQAGGTAVVSRRDVCERPEQVPGIRTVPDLVNPLRTLALPTDSAYRLTPVHGGTRNRTQQLASVEGLEASGENWLGVWDSHYATGRR